MENFYSYSLLALIVKKGYLTINQDTIKYINLPDFLVLPASLNIDKYIERIGGSHKSGSFIQNIDEYAQKIA